ncbi:6903_t:CDS:1, partial [Ambispora gerdemannii]
LRRLGAHHAVDLPTVVFCGNQSAGESSLLEAISGVQVQKNVILLKVLHY